MSGGGGGVGVGPSLDILALSDANKYCSIYEF